MIYEVHPISKDTPVSAWSHFIAKTSDLIGNFKTWKLYIYFNEPVIRYYLESPVSLPSSIDGCSDFLLKFTPEPPRVKIKKISHIPKIINPTSSVIDFFCGIKLKPKSQTLKLITFDFKKIFSDKITTRVHFSTSDGIRRPLMACSAARLLSINFTTTHNFLSKSAPKYLDIYKALPLFEETSTEESLVEIDAFPYLDKNLFLSTNKLDFAKHSIIFGASGSGKSKFLASLIKNILSSQENYKVVVIDPHAALENDIGGLGRVVDFKSDADYVNLFSSTKDAPVVQVELLLDIFRGLIATNYNSKLERVLRHTLYLLISSGKFDFKNLRKLLLDLEFRVDLIEKEKQNLPSSVVEFFLAEFNDIRTKSYTEAISPIIALIDELEMIPVFNHNIPTAPDLETTIHDNKLTLFSLSRAKLGDRATETISGFVMCQLFDLVQNHKFDEHIIFVIDEVAVVENPVLLRFLSEARKYNLSVILAGQYFGGISPALRTSIFANVINYYIFRVAKDDAGVLTTGLSMKVPLKDTEEQKIKILIGLQNRESIFRISANGELLPAFKCRTLDFVPVPRERQKAPADSIANYNIPTASPVFVFSPTTNHSLHDILALTSTRRLSAREIKERNTHE